MAWTNELQPFGKNHAPLLTGLSSSDGLTPVPVAVNPATGGLLTSGGAGGTQYASGTATPSPVTGNALIFDNSGTLQDVSVANPLPVSATFSGSISTAPTFAMNPSAGSPTAAYGLIDASYRPVVVGAGTAGTPAGGVLSVQGVSSGTALPISGTVTVNTISGFATSANQTNGTQIVSVQDLSGNLLQVAQASTTSGETGPLVQGATTTSAPTYTTAKTNPLSLDTAGNLRVLVGNTTVAVTQSSGPWTSNITQIGGSSLSIGTQTAANSVPVALPTATITTLTPPSNTGYALDSSLSTIDTDLKSNITLHAGTNLIGKVGIDQTTVGTTNAVSIAQIGSSTLTIGQQTAANSIPVILPSATVTTLTQPTLQSGSTTAVTQATASSLNAQAQIYDGTNVANVAATTAAVSDSGNSQLIAGTGYTTSTITLNAGTPNTSWFDMLNYTEVSVEILTNATPVTLSFQTSGDSSQTNARPVTAYDSSAGSNVPGTSTSSTNGTFNIPRAGRWFRISSTASGAQTATMVLTFYTSSASRLATASASVYGAGSTNFNITPIGGSNAGALEVISTNSTTYTSKNALDGNLLGTKGTAFSTAGFVDTLPGNTTGGAIPALAMPMGVQAVSADPTATTTTYNTIPIANLTGKQIVLPYAIQEKFNSGTTSATTNSSTSLISAVTSNKLYLVAVQVVNTSATTVYVSLQDGSGGTTKLVVAAPAGGGSNTVLPVPIANTAGNAWYFALSGSATTVYVSAQAYAEVT